MFCAIYKSDRKLDTYLYVDRRDDFSRVPSALLQMLGTPVYVMDLELGPQRRLAREDVREVIKNLRERGWHLQLPPRLGEELGRH